MDKMFANYLLISCDYTLLSNNGKMYVCLSFTSEKICRGYTVLTLSVRPSICPLFLNSDPVNKIQKFDPLEAVKMFKWR